MTILPIDFRLVRGVRWHANRAPSGIDFNLLKQKKSTRDFRRKIFRYGSIANVVLKIISKMKCVLFFLCRMMILADWITWLCAPFQRDGVCQNSNKNMCSACPPVLDLNHSMNIQGTMSNINVQCLWVHCFWVHWLAFVISFCRHA